MAIKVTYDTVEERAWIMSIVSTGVLNSDARWFKSRGLPLLNNVTYGPSKEMEAKIAKEREE